MMKKLLSLLILSQIWLQAGVINIAVASNVNYAIKELTEEFTLLYPKTRVAVTIGSSGKLTAQIKNGAPYGLFMSANMLYPFALYDAGIAIEKPHIYADGALALLSTKKRDFKEGISLLKKKDFKRIAVANPKTAPYGQAAIEALKNAHLYQEIKSKLIYGESISQTLGYTVTACDIGIIAKSALYSTKMSHFIQGRNWVSLDTQLYTPIHQGMVLLKNTPEYRNFYNFILSKQAKHIFKKYGYIIP